MRLKATKIVLVIAVGVLTFFLVRPGVQPTTHQVVVCKEESTIVNTTVRDYPMPLPDDQYNFEGLEEFFAKEYYRIPRKAPIPTEELMRYVAFHGKRWREKRAPDSANYVIGNFLGKPGILYEDLTRILGEPQDDCRKDGYTNYSVGDDLWVIGWKKEADGTWRFNGELSHP